jgi:hypothetical protein
MAADLVENTWKFLLNKLFVKMFKLFLTASNK